MPGVEDTAYPRFKKNINQRELEGIYTPTHEEIVFTQKNTKGKKANLCFLSLLKTFQRLGYFVLIDKIPKKIIKNIARKLHIPSIPDLSYYDKSKTRYRHMTLIRSYLKIVPYGDESIAIIKEAVQAASLVKEDLADIINIAIEELVRHKHEFPAFSALRRFAYEGRANVNEKLYRQITRKLTKKDKKNLDRLFVVEEDQQISPWQTVKSEPKNLTRQNLKERIEYNTWIDQYVTGLNALNLIPDVKIKKFSSEAKSMKAAEMEDLKLYKKYALAITLITVQKAVSLDDLGEMFIKQINKVHGKGRDALDKRIKKNVDRTDKLVDTLHQILIAHNEYENEKDRDIAINSIIGDRKDKLIKDCEEHAIYAGKNYFPFLWRFHASNRVALFDIINSVKLISSNQDKSLIEAIDFIKDHRTSKKAVIEISEDVAIPNLSWVPERWQKAAFGQVLKNEKPAKVNRQYFELCVFYQLMLGLKSGDICIEGSDQFSDYRAQLLSWPDFYKMIDQFGQQIGLPIEKKAFIYHVRSWFEGIAQKVDSSFPKNEYLKIENGKPMLKKSPKASTIQGLKRLESIIAERLEPVTILDVLNDTRKWLNWDKCLGPISGFESKLKEPFKNYIVAMFCYGCNLGVTQTSRSIKDFSRYQIAWVNQRHITEEKLNDAIVKVINAYDKFDLPKIWGSGKSASVDGKLWDLYEANLFAEHHIRYGGYGGIGYYHVSDQYITLFSRFIPCGVHEAIHILDGLLENESDIQPDTIHGDTHAQSETVFGLSYLLGIKMMPRIRNWKHLTFYKSRKETIYKHIEDLFSDRIDWDLIEKYLPDMLRVALSIKAGRISASSILRRLGTYSRKNKLYKAFRELGRVVRTAFLLDYLNDKELREIIQAATCKSESFNKFANWILFGEGGLITENNRDEQRKIIKYNHFVANCLSFHNVVNLTKIINDLVDEGYPINQEVVGGLSSYMTAHFNRFGDFRLNFDEDVRELVHDIHLPEFVD